MPNRTLATLKSYAPAYLTAGGWLWFCHSCIYWLAYDLCIFRTKVQGYGLQCEVAALQGTFAIAALALVPVAWAHWASCRRRAKDKAGNGAGTSGAPRWGTRLGIALCTGIVLLAYLSQGLASR